MIRSDNHVQYILLLPLGAVLGLFASLPIALALQLRAGEKELGEYAQRILSAEEAAAKETSAAVAAIAGDGQPFCSDADLAVMRGFVFSAGVVRDIGRVKNGLVDCTSVQGRLPAPVPVAQDGFSLGQTHVLPNASLSLISPGSTGIVIYTQDIFVVLNRSALDALDQAPLRATGLVFDPVHGRVFRAFGHDEPLSYADAMAHVPLLRANVYYLPLCSARYPVCVVASESRRDMFYRHRVDLGGYLIDGALLGNTAASILILTLVQRHSLEWRLRRAIRLRELACAYQPIVDLDSGACIGAEALARWVTASGESIPPTVFVPVAEQKAFVGALSRLVLDHVLKEMKPLLHREGFRVAINIGASDLSDPAFFGDLRQAVARAGVSPRSLAFELTEHSTADLETARTAIARLREEGYAVHIDDFGTGYSSLSYLEKLQVDAIKVDRVFTQTVGTEAVTASVVPQILEIARRLNLTVIVEGIENREQAEYFRKARGGILGQGWLLGRPVSAEAFQAHLAAQAAGRPTKEQPVP